MTGSPLITNRQWLRLVATVWSLITTASLTSAFLPSPLSIHRRSAQFSKFSSKIVLNNDASDENDNNNSFQDLGLCPEALEAVQAQWDWIEPTPIQQLAIPQLLNNDDNDNQQATAILCEAPTGTGKTAAFVLPLLQRLQAEAQQHSKRLLPGGIPQQSSQTDDDSQPKIKALICCPTRELCQQIYSVVSELGHSFATPWQTAVITGGVRRDDQIAHLAACVEAGQNVDVVVATPGRLVDVLTQYDTAVVVDSKNNDNHNDEDDDTTKTATEAALERRLLQAFETTGKASLSLEQINELKLDRHDDEGRSQLAGLLRNLDYLILDEADRLLARGFDAEMKAVLDLMAIQERTVPVTTWLFSATFPKLLEPKVEAVLQQLGQSSTTKLSCAQSDRLAHDQEEISATLQKKLERRQQQRTSDDDNDNTASPSKNQQKVRIGPASTIHLRTIRLDKRDRTQALRALWEENATQWSQGGVLVFVGTRYTSEHVARKLRRVGIRAAELHGKLDQEARQRRLQQLAQGKIDLLITTDLASRGLDVVGLQAVVNYDLPRSTADFVHRVGRTGRAGRQGEALTFVTAATEAHYNLLESRHIPPDNRPEREILAKFPIDEQQWSIQAASSVMRTPGAGPSSNTLAQDRMFGGIKGKRKSKKDRLREQAAAKAAAAVSNE